MYLIWCLVAATNAKNFRDFPVLDLKTLVSEFEWNATRELICIRHRADRPNVTSVDVVCPQWCQIMHATFYFIWLNIRVDRLKISRISLHFADVKYPHPHELINQSTFTFLSIVSKFKMILHCSEGRCNRERCENKHYFFDGTSSIFKRILTRVIRSSFWTCCIAGVCCASGRSWEL